MHRFASAEGKIRYQQCRAAVLYIAYAQLPLLCSILSLLDPPRLRTSVFLPVGYKGSRSLTHFPILHTLYCGD